MQGLLSLWGAAPFHFNGGSPEDLICTLEMDEYRGDVSANDGTDQLRTPLCSWLLSSKVQTPLPCAKYFETGNEV